MNDWLEIFKTGLTAAALMAACVSVRVAYLAYRVNRSKADDDRERDRDKELLAQVQRSLEWAYDALTDKGQHIPPKADRLNWLTCARHLLRCSSIAKRITSSTYKLLYAETEEFHRHRFYLALGHPTLRQPDYYRGPGGLAAPLEARSALVVLDFAEWKKGMSDPVDNVDQQRLMEGKPISLRHAALRDHVSWQQEKRTALRAHEDSASSDAAN